MNLLSDEQKGTLYAISSGVCYGLIGYFGVSLMNSGLSVFNMLFWRYFVATLFMLIILLPKYKMIFQEYKESLKVLFYGMALYSISTVFYFIASKYLGTGLSMVILFVFPAMVILLNIIFYKTKINKIYLFSFSILMIGMICLADIQGVTVDILGIGFGLLAALFYAFYIFFSKRIIISPAFSTLMVSAGSMITCYIASYLDSSFYMPNSFNTWLNIFGIALLCTVFPILLLLHGLKHIRSEKASMLSVLEPVFVVAFGIVLLDEKISNLQLVGTMIILSGALVIAVSSDNKIQQFSK